MMLVVFYFFTFYSRLAFLSSTRRPLTSLFTVHCSLFSLRSTSPLLQRKVGLVKASRRDFAELYGI